MKKVKFLAIALAVSLAMVMLACSQPVGYVSDNNEAAQTVKSLLVLPSAVTSVTQTAFDTDTTDHNVNMPATVNAGDLMIVLFTNDGSATVTTPGGWSPLASNVNGSAVRLSVYYKIAAGTEGGTTVNFATSAGEQAAAQVYSITDWNGTTPPEISTAATGPSPAPNPASLNPAGWDVANTLWLAVAGQDRGDQEGTTTYPASYTGGIGTLSSDVLGNCRTLSARRVHATASENPGAFTIPVSEEWVAFTIAVRPALRDLTISSTAGGSVITPGEGVFTYDGGTIVDLVATPNEGYRFVKWTGDVGAVEDVYAAETTITVNSDYVVTANFVALYDLTIAIFSTGGGSVVEPGEGVFTYDEGTVVDLVAVPDAGHRFVEWTGSVGTIADVHDASTTITMNDDYAITANFVATYYLTISSTKGGSVTTPGEGTFACDPGMVVTLVARPLNGYRFVEWTGGVGAIADVYDATTTITMNGDNAITANFVATYDLAVSSTEGGSVAEPGEGRHSYDKGRVVTLVASPISGYRFVNWTGGVDTIDNPNGASTFIIMNGNYAVTANFVAVYDLTTSSTEGGSVTEPGEGAFAYDEGTEVDLVAEAEEGYRFVEWAGDVGTIADVYASETTITINGDYSITAELEEVLQLYPTATTQIATNITTSSTRLNMSYTVGDFSRVQVCFAYKKSTDSAWSYTTWMSKTADGTHAEVLTELDFNTTYDFKARVRCGAAMVEGTVLQFTTDTPSPSGSGPCFIATAAYGSPTATEIDLLREFRDAVLLKSTVGSQFVALYYQTSPPVADFIAGNEFLTTLVRELLVDPIVWVVRAAGGR